MSCTWLLYFFVFILAFAFLKTLFFSSLLVNLGLCFLAWYISDIVIKACYNALPRKKIPMLSDKAVVITGCDSGFGMELAKTLDQKGMKVYAGCLLPDGDGANQLREVCSDRLKILPLDVSKESDALDAAKTVADTLEDKTLWALVNNAGVATVTEIEWCPVETYRRILDVNALGPIRVTKAFLPLLRESQGRVVMVASLAGRYTFPGFSAYSMSKYAAVSFADALRREMKKWGVSVHTIEPTLYKTPITEADGIKKELQKNWDQVPGNIQSAYGDEYFLDFQDTIFKHLARAKPSSKIAEVINDLVDAVTGESPKLRYVPSVVTQLRARILSSLPTELQDYVLCQGQPKTPPADVSARRSRVPSFEKVSGTGRPSFLDGRKRSLFRYLSLPVIQSAGPMPTPPEKESNGVQEFKF